MLLDIDSHIDAALSAATLVTVAIIGQGVRKRGKAAHEDRQEIKDNLKPSNGHETFGDQLHAIQDVQQTTLDKLDGFEVRFDEHLQQAAPITEWVQRQMEKEDQDG